MARLARHIFYSRAPDFRRAGTKPSGIVRPFAPYNPATNSPHADTDSVESAGPDHAQEAAAGAVLDYVELLHRHHGGTADDGLRVASAAASALWQAHETALVEPVLTWLAGCPAVRLLGPGSVADTGPLHLVHTHLHDGWVR